MSLYEGLGVETALIPEITGKDDSSTGTSISKNWSIHVYNGITDCAILTSILFSNFKNNPSIKYLNFNYSVLFFNVNWRSSTLTVLVVDKLLLLMLSDSVPPLHIVQCYHLTCLHHLQIVKTCPLVGQKAEGW